MMSVDVYVFRVHEKVVKFPERSINLISFYLNCGLITRFSIEL